MKRWPCLLISLLALLTMGFGPPRLCDSDYASYGLEPDQIRSIQWEDVPEVTAESVILVNSRTGRVVLGKNERERRAPASMTKIMTAIVALERGRQEQEMVVSGTDIRAWSKVQLYAGEELNMRQLLFCMLISSDNAASMTIARSLGGRYATFVGWMNDKAIEWGLADTHFGNPSGLDAEDGYSTAFDVATMVRNAMTYPTFAEIVRKPEWIVNMRVVETTNELLRVYPGMIGVKTGTTDLAGECLATVVERPEGRVISVVMGSNDRFSDTSRLLNYYYATFAEVTIDLGQTPQSRYMDSQGNWHDLVIDQPVTLLLRPWEVGSVSVYRRITDGSPTPAPDQPVGSLEISVGGQLIDQVPMYAQ